MNLSDTNIFYVTGPLHSGKTTRLKAWAEGRQDVAGVFQPVVNGNRYFVDILSGEKCRMDAGEEDQEVYVIGKYRFRIEAFAWASDVLVEALERQEVQYLIVDEIGPLEMQEMGLHPVLNDLLESPIPGVNIILVIRDYLLEEVLERYRVREMAAEFQYP